MELTKKVPTTDKNQENNHLLRMLARGIDDMEAGRELPPEDAFRKITELRDARRNNFFGKSGISGLFIISSRAPSSNDRK